MRTPRASTPSDEAVEMSSNEVVSKTYHWPLPSSISAPNSPEQLATARVPSPVNPIPPLALSRWNSAKSCVLSLKVDHR